MDQAHHAVGDGDGDTGGHQGALTGRHLLLLDALDDMADAGANAVRFWLHIDGSINPEWSPMTGLVSGLSLDTVNDLKWFLQAAADRGLAVVLSLWSHDMLAVRATNSAANRDRALRVVEDEAALDAYIRNALVPLLQDLGGSTLKGAHAGATMLDAVWAWETMNEPEGMVRDGGREERGGRG